MDKGPLGVRVGRSLPLFNGVLGAWPKFALDSAPVGHGAFPAGVGAGYAGQRGQQHKGGGGHGPPFCT